MIFTARTDTIELAHQFWRWLHSLFLFGMMAVNATLLSALSLTTTQQQQPSTSTSTLHQDERERIETIIFSGVGPAVERSRTCVAVVERKRQNRMEQTRKAEEGENSSETISNDAQDQQAAVVSNSSAKSTETSETASKDGEEDGGTSTNSEESNTPTPAAVGSSSGDHTGDSDTASASKKEKPKLRKGKWTVCLAYTC